MSIQTTETDLGAEAILRQAKAVHGARTEIGVQEDEPQHVDEDDATQMIHMATLMAVHEYGSNDGKTPARSVIEATMEEYGDYFNRVAAKLIRDGKDVDEILNTLGQVIQDKIKARFGSDKLAPLADATVARRKNHSNHPLDDTGQLKNSIRHKSYPRG